MGQTIDVQNLSTESLKEAAKPNIVTDDAFNSVGKEPGRWIWRIEKFAVKPWPKEEYGKFYSGDSYIILNTWKSEDGDKLNHDAHFWLGAETSQDEAGTAAYKAVELDESLGGAPVQHREVEGAESRLFLSYFKSYTVQKGGVESGFNHVEPEQYRTRLLHVSGAFKSLTVREVPLERASLNSSDVFIVDAGKRIVQFCGSSCSPFERQKAASVAENMEADRAGKAKAEVVEESDAGDDFWEFFGGRGEIAKESRSQSDPRTQSTERVLYRVSDAGGSLEFSRVDAISRDSLDTNDVFVLDAGWEAFVWIGKGASKQEKGSAINAAEKYLKQQGRPTTLPISAVYEGHERPLFNEALTGA